MNELIARRLAGWSVIAVAVAVVVFEVSAMGPIVVGNYQLSLFARLVSDALTVGLLAVLLLRPLHRGRSGRLFMWGAFFLSVAVVYRLVGQFIADLTPSDLLNIGLGPLIDPLIEAACMALGVGLLAIGTLRLGAPRGWWRGWTAVLVVAAVLIGALVFGLEMTLAVLSRPAQSLYNPGLFEDAQIAVFVPAAEAVGWVVLGIAAVASPVSPRTRLLLFSAAVLILMALGLDAFNSLTEWWWGPLRAWFPALLDWHGAYVYVAVFDGLGHGALFAAFVTLGSARPVSIAEPVPGEPGSRGNRLPSEPRGAQRHHLHQSEPAASRS